MNLRGGKETKYQAIKTKGFNMKGRADQPHTTNVLISSNEAVLKLGTSYGVKTFSAHPSVPSTLANAYAYEQELDKQLAGGTLDRRLHPSPQDANAMDVDPVAPKYLLIGYGDDYLYYAQAPLDTRGQRPNPAKPKPDTKFANGPDVDQFVIQVQWDAPVVNGLETPSKDSVMGGTALNYAAEVFDKSWAHERKWEWLHIVAHSLGGNNEYGNLVAGTFDGNTQMIPHEKKIRDLSQNAKTAPVVAEYTVDVYPGTWVAYSIEMKYGLALPGGHVSLTGIGDCRPSSMLAFDKLQYSLWSM